MATAPPSTLALLACLLAVATTSLTWAAPVPPPDLTNCQPPDLPSGVASFSCCIGNSANITNFTPPRNYGVLRLRRAAHQVDAAYILKYRTALALMKNLSSDDPRSFSRQANVHCAYCNGAYDQAGFSGVELQVHNSWLFLPWHRAYLYFYERILGKLINDSSFALPFWNWDFPAGMTLPGLYASDTSSPLYDKFRDALHQPPNVADLNFNGTDSSTPRGQTINYNLNTMYRQMISAAKTPSLFFGQPYRAGDSPNPGPGTLEVVPHNTVHLWTGDRTQPNVEDMGSFYSAGRDPIFFSHHSNVDRMWDIWINQLGNNNFNDTDWLDSSFYFWDENKQMVRIRVRDVLDISSLGYRYESVPLQWQNSRPTPNNSTARAKATAGATLPLNLRTPVNFQVSRPAGAGTGTEEALVIQNIQVNDGVYSMFDVYVDTATAVTPGSSNFAGSFVHVSMGNNRQVTIKELVIGCSQAFSSIGVGNATSVVVTLVPRTPANTITVGGIQIQLVTS